MLALQSTYGRRTAACFVEIGACQGRAGSAMVVVLFDNGADRTTDLVRKVSVEWVDTQTHSYPAFESVNVLGHLFNVVLEGSPG